MSLRSKPKKDANDLGAARFGKKTPGAYENVDPFIRFRQKQNRVSQSTVSANAPSPWASVGKGSSTGQDGTGWARPASVLEMDGVTGDMMAVLDDITNEPKRDSGYSDIPAPAPSISIISQCMVTVPKAADSTSAMNEKVAMENKALSRKEKTVSKSPNAGTTHALPLSDARSSSSVVNSDTTSIALPPTSTPKVVKADIASAAPPPKPTEIQDVFSSEAAVERKMKSLLNKLTERTFESISNQVLQYVNRSSEEQDAETMKLVIKLICDKAVEDHFWARLYAQLCERIWKGIDQCITVCSVDDPLHGLEGGDLFRHCLLKHCQREFLAGLEQRTAEGPSEETGALNQGSIAFQDSGKESEVVSGAEVVFSDEYYAKEAIKRKAKGLIKLMGELYNIVMLGTSAILQVFGLLMDNGSDGMEEFEIKLACGLLTTISTELLRREAQLPRREKIEGIVNQLKVINSDRGTSIRTSCYLQASIELLDVHKSRADMKTAVAMKSPTVGSTTKTEKTPKAKVVQQKITFDDLELEPPQITLGKQVFVKPVPVISAPSTPLAEITSAAETTASPPQPSSPVENGSSSECDAIVPTRQPSPEPTVELNPIMLGDIKRVLATTKANQAKQCGQQLIEKSTSALQAKLVKRWNRSSYTSLERSQLTAAIMIKAIWSHATSHIQLEEVTSSNGSQVRGGKLCKELVATMMRDESAKVWEDCGLRGDRPRTSIDENGKVILDFVIKLFIEDQLSPKIICDCLRRLLTDVATPLESDVDQLCRILERTGAKLYKLNSSALAVYVARFRLLTRSSISKPAKKRVESVLDLAASGWKRTSSY